MKRHPGRQRDWGSVVPVLFVLVIFLMIGGCMKWKYKECKKVGHGTAYCTWQTLKK